MGLADSNQSPIESYKRNDNQLVSKLTTLLKVEADFHYKRAIEYKESNLAKYKEHLFIAANQGHIVASYELAWELDRVQISSSEFMHSYELTAFYYTFAAEHGHHLAQFRTGYCFEHGLGVSKSLEKAAYYYSLAANAGIFYGYALLGQCYELGRGVEQSLEKAKQNYAHLVNTEWINPEVIYDIAEKYLFRANKYNLATTPSYDSDFLREKSFRLFQLVFLYYRAKDLVLGDLGAHFQVIDFYEKNLGIVENDSIATAYKDLNNSIRLQLLNLDLEKNTLKHQKLRGFLDLQALANDSDESDNKTNAEYALATNYAQGIGLELQPSPTLFQYYIFKAAREHHVDALFEIGKSYDWGENDFPYAPRKAAEYYLKAADLGHPAAQFAIGNFFEKGIVVDQSHSKALEYYKNAALQENKGALGMLGILMEFESNISEATKYYQKCANCNWSENELLKDIEQARKMPSQSSHRLNRCYQEAFIYYRIKAESSDADAQCKVADFLRLGWFELHNEEFALPLSKKYYELAALQDHPKAQCWLGYILERENDFESAFKYYEKASKQGNACAMGLLGMCYEEGKGTSENLAKAHGCYKLSDNGLWKNEQFFDSSFHFGHVERFIYSYLREATESAETKAILADCYETGDGVIASAELSSYYRLLAENVSKGWHTSLIKEANDGNANSQYILSFLYDKGSFIPPSQALLKT